MTSPTKLYNPAKRTPVQKTYEQLEPTVRGYSRIRFDDGGPEHVHGEALPAATVAAIQTHAFDHPTQLVADATALLEDTTPILFSGDQVYSLIMLQREFWVHAGAGKSGPVIHIMQNGAIVVFTLGRTLCKKSPQVPWEAVV